MKPESSSTDDIRRWLYVKNKSVVRRRGLTGFTQVGKVGSPALIYIYAFSIFFYPE